MMTGLEKRDAAAAKQEEEEMLLMEGMAVLDFDMLCSTVAMQAEKGTWGKLNESNEDEEEAILFRNNENGGGVFRMWEGELIYDCFDHRQIALQSTCCPCYRFGRNMKRAGFGSCFLQGFFYSILLVIALSNLLAFIITRRHFFLYLAIAFTVSIGTYVGFYRSQIKKKFNIKVVITLDKEQLAECIFVFHYFRAYIIWRSVILVVLGSDSSLDDCVYHLTCPCCTLSQESRTLEMNNVQDGIWHGRGDTICVGSYSEGNKALFEFSPSFAMSTQSPECHTMQKTSSNHLSTSVVVDSSPFVPPSD